MGHSRASTHALVARGGSSRSSPVWAGVAAGAVMIVGSAGAHETQAVAVKVTAKRVTARAVTPTAKVTDVATVQQADGTGRVQARRHTIPFLSPLGAAGLKAAKATAKAHAAFATQIIQAMRRASRTRPTPRSRESTG